MPDLARIRTDYDHAALAYGDFVSSSANDQKLPGAMIAAFAASVTGHVLDAGCGPGHWTAYLRDRGLDAEGVDLSPALIAIARDRRPEITYSVGNLLELTAEDDSFDGVLANFSLIHTPPEEVPTVLGEFARVLTDGGGLLIGGFAHLDGPGDWVEYDHTVCPAFRWSPDALAAVVRAAGFAESARLVMQPPPGTRSPGVYLLARKTAT